jgi:WD40 repeat protein
MNIRTRRALVPAVALGLVLAATPAYAGVSSTPDVTGQAVGGVYAIADAGDRTIIGGLFTRYGGRERANVAAINANGTVDTAWNPGTNGVVKAVALSEDKTTVFLGGVFTTVGGQPRANLAAVDAVTGEVRASWVANTGGTTPDVNSLAVKGDRLYVGGRYGSIDGTTRKRLVALDVATGDVITSFRPAPNGMIREVVVSPDGTKVYAGGGFSVIGGQTRGARAAELLASTGAATAFNPSGDGGNAVTVEITPDGSRFFYSTENNTVFAYDLGGSNSPVWSRKMSGNTQAMAASATGELYLGGHFSQDLTTKLKRTYYASFEYDTGTLTDWDPNASGGKAGVWAFLIDGDKLHTGGFFRYFNTTTQQRGYARFSGTP